MFVVFYSDSSNLYIIHNSFCSQIILLVIMYNHLILLQSQNKEDKQAKSACSIAHSVKFCYEIRKKRFVYIIPL